MAEVITLVDDLDQSADNVARHTFALDGTVWQIDLSEKNLEKLTKALRPFIDAGSPAAQGAKPARGWPSKIPVAAKPARKRRGRAPAAAAVDAKAVRAWADENNVVVSPRGRIPKPVIDQYLAATGS